MYKIIGIRKTDKAEIIVSTAETERAAERFCEAWGWNYDDGGCSYWLEYEEA